MNPIGGASLKITLKPSDTQFRELMRVFRFGIVGVINTGVDVGVFSLLLFIFDTPVLAANTVGYLTGLCGSFFLNKHWTFSETRDQGHTGRQFLLFAGLGLGGLALSNLVVWSLVHFLPEIVSKLASVAVVFIWNFVTSRLIVFRAKPGEPTL